MRVHRLARRSLASTSCRRERGEGNIERSLNLLGKFYHSNFAYYDFSKHAELVTKKTHDHISCGNESSMTTDGNAATFDKLCKWFTVEGLPGAGKAAFAENFSEGTGVKNFGTGNLNWELERIEKVLEHISHYKNMKKLNDEGMHYLSMRGVDIEKFFNDPNDPVHSCRMQDHMKLQRHIHSMDALRHLLTYAEGVITNRTYHSDYAFATAMYKMGYMSKNFYEMRYAVSHATADGSGTATDLTPNVSFYLDISPEESFETIKARGNEAEIATCNLEFLKHLQEAYIDTWQKDMNSKGCTVLTLPKDPNMDDLFDFITEAPESELRHPYSRWSYATENQSGMNNRSQRYGIAHAALDGLNPANYARFTRSNSWLSGLLRFWQGGIAGNGYEKALQNDLTKGPAYSYEILHTFHPWDELAESASYLDMYKTLHYNEEYIYSCWAGKTLDMGSDYHAHNKMPYQFHPDWQPKSSDVFNNGYTPLYKILFGSDTKYIGDEHVYNHTGWKKQL